MAELPLYDLQSIRKAIAVLFGDVKFGDGECIEVRIMDKKKGLIVSGWFDDPTMLAKTIALAARDGVEGDKWRFVQDNVYWTINPVDDALLSRQTKNLLEFVKESTSDANVTRRLWLPIDIDPKRPAGVSASDEERKLARQVANELMAKLGEIGFTGNMIVGGTSGNGYHVLIRIDLCNDKESADLVRDCLKALDEMVGTDRVDIDPTVFNAARILKSYGTVARKGVNGDKRPWRMSKLTIVPEKVEVAPRALLEKLAAMAPKANAKKVSASKAQGAWTEENTQKYIDEGTDWDCKRLPGGRPGEVCRWVGRCVNDDSHQDAAIILHDDGWWSYGCFHASCDEFRHREFMTYWAERKGEYPYPGLRAVVDLENDRAWRVPVVDAKVEEAAAETQDAKTVDYSAIKAIVDETMRTPSKDLSVREKHRIVCDDVYRHMTKHGKLYDCGNVAVYLVGETREMIQVIKGSPKFNRLLLDYGIIPTDSLCDAMGQYLGARAITDATKATVYTLSFYDTKAHVLYVNDYGGNFLRINGDGVITRHRNGEFDMLFADGSESECEPLRADIEVPGRQLSFGTLCVDEGSTLIRDNILDTIIYDKARLGRESAHMLLMTSILCLFLYERCPSYPYVFLFGAGASMKSSLAKAVGRLIQGHKFRVRFSEDDVQQMKDLAMSLPFLVLDEANNIKKLQNLLKAIGTGAMDSRRELYTTAQMRYTPYQARIWMTANTASLTNETISSRMLIIDAAPRTEAEPYRSEHYLEWDAGVRNRIWTELVGRLAGAMVALTQADAKGRGDLHVDHRMSSFFVLGRAIALQEGYEDRFMEVMRRITGRQQAASAEGNDIVDVVKKLPKSYCGTPRLAREWAEILAGMVDDRNRELVAAVSRPGWVAWKFSSEFHTLTRECGLKVWPDKHNNTTRYSFEKLDAESNAYHDALAEMM